MTLQFRVLLAICLATTTARVNAEAGWFESGDSQLRIDLQLLNDADVIRYPLNQWPIPAEGLRYAMSSAKDHFATNAAVQAALLRMKARIEALPRGTSFDASASGGRPGLWRDFDTPAREEAELRAGVDYANPRFAASLNASAVNDPADGEEFRLDGSHATVQLGNWLLSAHTLDRWWGPGHEGSLILSNNARPMPTLAVERAAAKPFESRWLDWLGPWRFSFALSQMEDGRADVDSPLFMAWRVVVMPFKKIELGFSRTAQFCGDGQECTLNSFGNLLAGNDNVGIDATEENEPGNQMAGFDIRWNSPIGNLPYAIYSQMIGEDESSYMPAKYLSQFGIEMWRPNTSGGLAQYFLEYATTTCSAHTDRGPYYNCAYNQGIFNADGYRYHGRTMGYTADRDAENWALGASYSRPDGTLLTATARLSQLNRDDYNDFLNPVAQFPTDYSAIEFGWSGRVRGAKVSIDLGLQSLERYDEDRDLKVYGSVSWRYELTP